MDFDDDARLDTSRTRRGGGGRSAGRSLAVGGGGLGLVVAVVIALLGGDPSSLLQDGGGRPAGAPSGPDLAAECRTGADADRNADCRVVALENSLSEYWSGAVQDFTPPTYTLFQGSVQTGCGGATSAVGPFYCPADQGVYLDQGFFEELRTTYGAKGGDFAVAYVLAHEYGHHVQSVTGQTDRARRLPDQTGPQGGGTRLELQADCFAGVWAANAQQAGLVTFDDGDVAEGLSAAAAVGDDRIQEKSQGSVDPESWTHGSAEQRQRWFTTGLRAGEPGACDTFRGTV